MKPWLLPRYTSLQATIIHSSLLRVVDTPEPLPAANVTAIQAKCEEWMAKLKGITFSPSHLWMVWESEFSTITGDRHRIPLALP